MSISFAFSVSVISKSAFSGGFLDGAEGFDPEGFLGGIVPDLGVGVEGGVPGSFVGGGSVGALDSVFKKSGVSRTINSSSYRCTSANIDYPSAAENTV